MAKTSINATKKWWHEGRGHIEAKNTVRQVLKKYGWACVEEEPFGVDLHDVFPELYESKNFRGYQMDIYATKGKGEHKQERLIQIDGEYHYEVKQKKKDDQQDIAIEKVYGHKVRRLDKLAILRGDYTEEQLREILEI